MVFDGAWKVDRNENYDKFMEKTGIMVKKKQEAHDSLKVTVSREGDKFPRTIQEETSWSKGSRAGASLDSVKHKRVNSVQRPAITD